MVSPSIWKILGSGPPSISSGVFLVENLALFGTKLAVFDKTTGNHDAMTAKCKQSDVK